MKNRGIGTTIDLFVLSLIVCLSCLLLIGNAPIQKNKSSRYPQIVSQNTLLALHHVKVNDIGKLSYSPNLEIKNNKKCVIKRKTLTRLLLEDIILNPCIKVDNKTIEPRLNREYDKKIDRLLLKFLNEFLDERFGFKLKINLEEVEITEKIKIGFNKTLVNISQDSRKLSEETISVDLEFPSSFINKISKFSKVRNDSLTGNLENRGLDRSLKKSIKRNSSFSSSQFGTLKITLELWSN